MIPHTASRSSNTLAIVSVALLCSSLSLLQACSNESGQSSRPDPTDSATYAEGQAYTVRGVIVQLPEAGPPPKEFKIHHEHIPNFIGASGEVFVNNDASKTPGMRSMVMAFPNLAPTISLDDFAVGDKIEFEFLVRWDANAAGDRTPTWLINAMTKLPADTEISFENKPVP